jgi:hypothetical protein
VPATTAFHPRLPGLGATLDYEAEIDDPQRGPGVLEIKTVFDYATWAQDWSEERAPACFEIQKPIAPKLAELLEQAKRELKADIAKGFEQGARVWAAQTNQVFESHAARLARLEQRAKRR